MSYTPLNVRYGTAVEPWHTLALWYDADTPLPLHRDTTKRPRRYQPRFTSVGQLPVTSPVRSGREEQRTQFAFYGVVGVGALIGAGIARRRGRSWSASVGYGALGAAIAGAVPVLLLARGYGYG